MDFRNERSNSILLSKSTENIDQMKFEMCMLFFWSWNKSNSWCWQFTGEQRSGREKSAEMLKYV